MKRIKVNPGVCGLESIITADGDGETDITITIETKCAHVRKMIAALEQPVDAYEACFVKPGQGPVYEAAVNLAQMHRSRGRARAAQRREL